ncbi:hypothetical protein [Streptomyces sp. FZ201]|uniref:hypothetical protein n=1 Tax=Streptomyces sp. FZ201 TaxID=3057122 RepID=UPI0021C1E8CE|nr:hypothetical protein [Streptomyces sp. FZ201]
MTDRSRLHHARGTAEDIPGLLEAVGPDPRDPGWDTLSDLLWSQGTVYPASFAALPRLTELARRWSPVERCMPLFLASRIVAARDIRGEAVDPFVTHTATLAELLALTEEALRDPSLADDSTTYVNLLSTLLAFEGVEGWSEHLDDINGDEYEVPCPDCFSENFVVLGEDGHYSTDDDMYFERTPDVRIPLRPQDPATADGLLPGLHARALADGHPRLADKLRSVFGRAQCAHCGAHFSIPDAILSRCWPGAPGPRAAGATGPGGARAADARLRPRLGGAAST